MAGRAFEFSGVLLPDGKTSIRVQSDWTKNRPFFEDLYGYLIKQYCHGNKGDRLGEGSQVVTKSDPDPDLAAKHFDHIHFDVPQGDLCPLEQPENK